MENIYNEELLADGWLCIDLDSNQYMKVLDNEEYEFCEDRVDNPKLGTTYVYKATIDLKDYSLKEVIEGCSGYYPAEKVTEWWNDKSELALIAECIFEMSN